MARTSGAKSYANIRIEDLVKAFSENTIVPVSRVWLREMNVQLQESVSKLDTHETPTMPPPPNDTQENKETVLAGISESDVSDHA